MLKLFSLWQVLYGLGGLLRSYQRDLLALILGGGAASAGDLLPVLTGIFSVSVEKESPSYLAVAKSVWRLRKVVLALYKTRPEERLAVEIR